MRAIPTAAVTIASILLGLAGCKESAGGRGGTGGTGGNEGGCIEQTISRPKMWPMSMARIGIEARITPELPGASRSRAVLDLYDYDYAKGEPVPFETGTFDLAASPDDNPDTCLHCVLLGAFDERDQPIRWFFPEKGTLRLEKIDDEEYDVAAGVAENLVLTEVERGEDGWKRVAGSTCYSIREWVFDTTPVNGIPCERVEDCGNSRRQVCDPKTHTCTDFQCLMTWDLVCPANEICRSQDPDMESVGACYTTCKPQTSARCSPTSDCVALDPAQELGICLEAGPAALGDPCDPSPLNTGCELGAICVGNPPRCELQCDYLTPEPVCFGEKVCNSHNICRSKETGDPAPIGGTCGPDSTFFTDCAPDDRAFRGACLSLFPEDPIQTCHRTCRTKAPLCGEGEYCAQIFDNEHVGICWPIPVCGDGVIDPLSEICDDGNADSSDGCSGDCKTAEFDVLCSKAEPLVEGLNLGSTAGGPTGYGGSCVTYIVNPTKTFSFLPPGPGRLSLELLSVANLDLVVFSDCADPMSELGCRSLDANVERLNLDFAEVPDKPLLVTVRGSKIGEVGDFELKASFMHAVCGDGVVVGPEVCDDGNTTSGDGCSADCTVIEWPQVCAGLPQLSLDGPNRGDTSSHQNLFHGWCTFVLGDGAEAMYQFTAPRDGTLSLLLDGISSRFALYLVDGCDDAIQESILKCSNSGGPPDGTEQITYPLEAGQRVTVVVDDFFPDASGSFSLHARFD